MHMSCKIRGMLIRKVDVSYIQGILDWLELYGENFKKIMEIPPLQGLEKFSLVGELGEWLVPSLLLFPIICFPFDDDKRGGTERSPGSPLAKQGQKGLKHTAKFELSLRKHWLIKLLIKLFW